jgi:hypothetical protein
MTPPPARTCPAAVITVDVEGDNQWARPATVTTENARHLPRFHALCAAHGLKPVYLTTYEMATSPEFRAFARSVHRHGEAEIGAHPHAWTTPPHPDPRLAAAGMQPYLTQFDRDTMRAKIVALAQVLEDVIGEAVRSHRAGRWAFDAAYAHLLAERGFWVDSSVTPHVNWRRPSPSGADAAAPDYSGFPEIPYFLDLDTIRGAGSSDLLEVPMTTSRITFERAGPAAPYFVRWMRPNGRNLRAILWLTRLVLAEARPCVVLAIHSSELMPGGSPGVVDVEAFYRDLDVVFRTLADECRPMTLTEFYEEQTRLRDRSRIAGG